jgi:hypothetical protein
MGHRQSLPKDNSQLNTKAPALQQKQVVPLAFHGLSRIHEWLIDIGIRLSSIEKKSTKVPFPKLNLAKTILGYLIDFHGDVLSSLPLSYYRSFERIGARFKVIQIPKRAR